jgi:hypothetical protein
MLGQAKQGGGSTGSGRGGPDPGRGGGYHGGRGGGYHGGRGGGPDPGRGGGPDPGRGGGRGGRGGRGGQGGRGQRLIESFESNPQLNFHLSADDPRAYLSDHLLVGANANGNGNNLRIATFNVASNRMAMNGALGNINSDGEYAGLISGENFPDHDFHRNRIVEYVIEQLELFNVICIQEIDLRTVEKLRSKGICVEFVEPYLNSNTGGEGIAYKMEEVSVQNSEPLFDRWNDQHTGEERSKLIGQTAEIIHCGVIYSICNIHFDASAARYNLQNLQQVISNRSFDFVVGDFNLTWPTIPGFIVIGSNHVDHIFQANPNSTIASDSRNRDSNNRSAGGASYRNSNIIKPNSRVSNNRDSNSSSDSWNRNSNNRSVGSSSFRDSNSSSDSRNRSAGSSSFRDSNSSSNSWNRDFNNRSAGGASFRDSNSSSDSRNRSAGGASFRDSNSSSNSWNRDFNNRSAGGASFRDSNSSSNSWIRNSNNRSAGSASFRKRKSENDSESENESDSNDEKKKKRN